MKINKDGSILIEVQDIETAFSKRSGHEVKISDVSCTVYVHEFADGYQGVDWVQFSIDGLDPQTDSDLWCGEKLVSPKGKSYDLGDSICDSLKDIEVNIYELEGSENEIFRRIFSFDARQTFKSIDFGIS